MEPFPHEAGVSLLFFVGCLWYRRFLSDVGECIYWILEYYTLILFLVQGSYISHLSLNSIYIFPGSTPD